MTRLEQVGNMNRVVLYGHMEAAIPRGGAGGWKARQVALTVRRWVVE